MPLGLIDNVYINFIFVLMEIYVLTNKIYCIVNNFCLQKYYLGVYSIDLEDALYIFLY